MEYWMITTTDDKGNEALRGGMMKRQNPQHGITNFIGVDSIDDYSSKVQQVGLATDCGWRNDVEQNYIAKRYV